ncbi:hypothetical protein NQ176_g7367 [Zarea fungicola]|uniref:Uncharacterized protein n=1 Tax=Zarea fungicola TaxID=93591 RepID=A0ACC1MYF0_9HYPO|nr:hypothetical protein NQ176_g7367 [Lecanicillium fungicola]
MQTPSTQEKVVGLVQVSQNRDAADTNIDIIAIPGLDAASPSTWTWRAPGNPKDKKNYVNWLEDGNMLPSNIPKARIFTCDWPTSMLQQSVPTTLEQSAQFLLESVEQHLKQNKQARNSRPILFIASCLGGIVLLKALEIDQNRNDGNDSGYSTLVTATRGIIFLATPFRGTAFKDMPDLTLRIWAAFNDKTVTSLINYTRQPPPDLDELLVDENSARAHLFERERLNRRHVLMNKFGSPYCEDYKKVVDKVREITENIHECTPLEKADKLMREKYYTESRLRIERLSGEPLSLDQCYINLAIVESFGPDGAHSKGSTSSPFSLLSRQNIQAPESSKKIKLEEIFNQRDGGNAGAMHPRRILIRGRAGVGKTTLCKKIVLEFNKGTLGRWNELFDRVLWVPLRNLKLPARLNMPKYTFKDLFSHEFLLPEKEPDLAGALHRALEAASSRTIFLLDGLDEVSQDLAGEGSIPRFLKDLLSQPNVVITSRPSAPPPSNMDLELETIGFGPDQVNQYIEKSFINSKTTEFDTFKISKIQSFLQEHWLLQGLVRIPIQLDALCYTWDCLDLNTELNTMTGIYSEIELKLWKKDIMQLKKKHGNDVLTRELLASAIHTKPLTK